MMGMRRRITLCGSVQGVGFRPLVYRRAHQLGLGGWVVNSSAGLTIEAEGDPAGIANLLDTVRQSPPPHARVRRVTVEEMEPLGERVFSIRGSEVIAAHGTEVPPDLATCPACLAELFDPTNRRHRYPFISCTQCGPRFSIVEGMPYDRSRTSMRRFAMCPACRAEYEGPDDRRFHAEPNACPACGPQLALWDERGVAQSGGEDALAAAVDAIRDGRIVAAKGIGGFHLMVGAHDEEAVRRLRLRKRRADKPFAVMFPDLAAVRSMCRVETPAAAALRAPEGPIVLLERHASGDLAPSVAPGNYRLGALLPYAPLHHLMMADLGFPVVATSGNLAEEPIVIDETAAVDRLRGIADVFLVHDRPIARPLDDSIVQLVCGRSQILRRARGRAPSVLTGTGTRDGMLAYGSHLKASVALGTPGGVVVSQHLGDLDSAAARRGFDSTIADLVSLQGAAPRRVVCDLHPDYASSRAAQASGLATIAVQHHVAHIAACLGEHGLEPPALGVAWDGTGYGTDGASWGGEFIRVDRHGWRRVATLRPFRLPGGDAASREPRRAALGLLHAAFGARALTMIDLPPVASFAPAERSVLRVALERGLNAPLTSSMGRLFDAFAALCGLRQRSTYEGQAASELEAHASTGGRYPFVVHDGGDDAWPLIVDWQPALEAALGDLRAGRAPGVVSTALHNGLIGAIVDVAIRIGEPRVALTGGCFQNVRLTEAAVDALRTAGFMPVWHQNVPPNDGGIAFGQAIWAGWMDAAGATPCA